PEMQVERDERSRVSDRSRVAEQRDDERAPEQPARRRRKAELPGEAQKALQLPQPMAERGPKASALRVEYQPHFQRASEVLLGCERSLDHGKVVAQHVRPGTHGREIDAPGPLIPQLRRAAADLPP